MMDFPLPDGTYIRDVPEGTTRQEIMARLINAGEARRLAPALDPSEGMGEGEKALAGWQKWYHDQILGAKQRLGFASTADVEEMQRRDAPLMQHGAAQAGYAGSAVLNTAATAFIPGLNTMKGAAMLGGVLGATTPTDRYTDPLANIAMGAGFGAGGQVAGRFLSGAPPIRSQLNPIQQANVDLARGKYGMDLPASTVLGNPRLAYMESQLATLPGGGRMQAMLRRPQEQFGEAVMREAGGAGLPTTSTLRAAREGTSLGYGNVYRGKMLELDGTFTQQLDDVWREAQRLLPQHEQDIVRRQIDNIWHKVRPTSPSTVAIEGDVYQRTLRRQLRAATPEEGSMAPVMMRLRAALDEMAQRNLSSSENEAISQLNREWMVQRGLIPMVGRAEARGGTFTPSQLMGEFGTNRGNIGELARIGPILREPPQSGTVPRAVSTAILGGTGYVGSGGDPYMTALAVGGPAAAARILASPAMQRYITQGFGNFSPITRRMIEAASRGGALAAPGLLTYP